MKPSAQIRLRQKAIKNAVFQAQKKAAKELVQILIDAIRMRVRQLHLLSNEKTIPKLKPSTVLYRERYSKNLAQDTSPKTSNATATGQMIDSMRGKATGTKITIDLKPARKKELSGSKSTQTNVEVNKWYEKGKGEWFGLSEKDKQEGIDYATELIKEEIKKVLK